MRSLRARVDNGRLLLDEPPDRPDGLELDLVVDDQGDDLTASERQALHDTLMTSWQSAQTGDVRPASELIEELRRRR